MRYAHLLFFLDLHTTHQKILGNEVKAMPSLNHAPTTKMGATQLVPGESM